jgi:hypothetical protein
MTVSISQLVLRCVVFKITEGGRRCCSNAADRKPVKAGRKPRNLGIADGIGAHKVEGAII